MELNMWLYKDGLPRHDISLIVDSSQNTDNLLNVRVGVSMDAHL